MADQTQLFELIRAGDLDGVRAALAEDASLASAKNAAGVSAVLFSVYNGRREIRDLLLATGAQLDLADAAALGDLNAARRLVDANPAAAASYSADGFPVVALAAVFGHLDVVRFLAEHGANVDAVATNGSGYNALTGAVNGGHAELVRWLLEHGADPNYRYAKGYAPFLAAAANGQLEILKLLLAHGADRNARMDDGKSALDLATERKHPAVVAFLIDGAASAY